MDFDFGNGSREVLLELGRILDAGGEPALELTEKVLKIRNRLGSNVGLAANAAQRKYATEAGRRNIILKARQMGVTTWIAGRAARGRQVRRAGREGRQLRTLPGARRPVIARQRRSG